MLLINRKTDNTPITAEEYINRLGHQVKVIAKNSIANIPPNMRKQVTLGVKFIHQLNIGDNKSTNLLIINKTIDRPERYTPEIDSFQTPIDGYDPKYINSVLKYILTKTENKLKEIDFDRSVWNSTFKYQLNQYFLKNKLTRFSHNAELIYDGKKLLSIILTIW